MCLVALLLLGSVAMAQEVGKEGLQKETTVVSATTFELMYITRYSLSDMQFKDPMLGVNLLPKRFKYVDFITLIGTEGNLTDDNVQWQVGMGVRTNIEALDFSDDVANWLQSRMNITLPAGLSIGPNLNPYGLVDPIETVKRFCNAIGDSTFKEEFNQDYFQNHTDGGVMITFVQYDIKF